LGLVNDFLGSFLLDMLDLVTIGLSNDLNLLGLADLFK
jgi:hypothetical protein